MRLNSLQTRKIVGDLFPQGLGAERIPEPLSQGAMESFCSGMAGSPGGISYGWFTDQLEPRAFLVGIVAPDPMTGVLTGFEHAWWSSKPGSGLELFRAFETDCRKAGCRRITFGYSHFVNPDKTRALYERLGYSGYNTAMSKEL